MVNKRNTNYEEIIYNISDIPSISNRLLQNFTNRLICLYGEMGSGKTTLIKQMASGLGSDDNGSSPTFGMVNLYENKKGQPIAYHLDCYRINNTDEALNLGIEEYLNSSLWVFIEWPQNIEALLPKERTEIKLEILNESTRRLCMQNSY